MEDFLVVKKIGKGSHGTVYLLKSIKKKKYLVCKSYNHVTAAKGIKESIILKNLSHKNIIKYYYTEFEGGSIYNFMEYCNYGTLEDFNRYFLNKNVCEEQVVTIYSQIIEGLYYLKKKGVIHKDIKPGNILLHKRKEEKFFRVKICDFSLSSYSFSVKPSIIGTPYYIAPEIYQKQNYSYSVDVWSLGVCFYETVSKTKPFCGESREEIVNSVLYKEIGQVPKIKSKKVEHLILNCLRSSDRRITINSLRNSVLIKKSIKNLNKNPFA